MALSFGAKRTEKFAKSLISVPAAGFISVKSLCPDTNSYLMKVGWRLPTV